MSNLNEEEKKVTKKLEDDIKLVTFNGNLNYGVGNLYVNINDLKIALNLIDRLQKENEEYVKRIRRLCKSDIVCLYDTVDLNGKYIKDIKNLDNDYISKYKIRQLLKQVNSSIGHFKATDSNNIMFRIKDRLEDLLKENNNE